MGCEHKEREDCLVCARCGECREDLDDADTCMDCGGVDVNDSWLGTTQGDGKVRIY
jgi:hypothetical protein